MQRGSLGRPERVHRRRRSPQLSGGCVDWEGSASGFAYFTAQRAAYPKIVAVGRTIDGQGPRNPRPPRKPRSRRPDQQREHLPGHRARYPGRRGKRRPPRTSNLKSGRSIRHDDRFIQGPRPRSTRVFCRAPQGRPRNGVSSMTGPRRCAMPGLAPRQVSAEPRR